MRNDAERRRPGDYGDLEAVYQALADRERIQREQREAMLKDNRDQETPRPRLRLPATSSQVAGKKRKSTGAEQAEPQTEEGSPRKLLKGHRRSQTVGTVTDATKSLGGVPSRQIPRTRSPGRFGSSIFSSKSTPPQNLGQSTLRPKLDTTKTDYFRFKALGLGAVPGNSPTSTSGSPHGSRRLKEIPHVLHAKERDQKTSPRPAASQPGPVSPSTTTPFAAPGASPLTPPRPSSSHQSSPKFVEPEDDLLRQVRKMRAAMSEDTEWFKKQTAEIEKEVERQEALARSVSSQSSPVVASVSADGLVRVGSYEYLPNDAKPGEQLSRTEQRIRRTGAHGLATKPIGGGSGYYIPVAMSKQSALRYSSGRQTSGVDRSDTSQSPLVSPQQQAVRTRPSPGRALPVLEKPPPRKRPSLEIEDEEVVADGSDRSSRGTRGPEARRVKVNGPSSNPFTPLDHIPLDEGSQTGSESEGDDIEEDWGREGEYYDDEDEDEEDGEGEDDDEGGEEADNPNDLLYEDDAEEEDDEDDEDELRQHEVDEEEEEAVPTTDEAGAHGHLDSRHLRPPPLSQTPPAGGSTKGGYQMSRATSGSGTGTSVADAVVLDDSD